MKACDIKPCSSCPWIKSNPPTGERIPRFDMNLMHNLAKTSPPRGSKEDGFYTVMACHNSTDNKPFGCAGYMHVVGLNHNINARLLAVMEDLDTRRLEANCSELELYPDFHTMLDAYEAAQ